MAKEKKRKEEWWVYYRTGGSIFDEDQLVILPSVGKLLLWIARNGHRCTEVEIILREA